MDLTEVEDGECSSDDSIAGYTPIERPVESKPSRHTEVVDDSEDEEDAPGGILPSDSDSEEDRPALKKRNKGGLWGRRDAIIPDGGGNETFKMMAAAFQEERKTKRKNNIWGSIIQEESLNSTLSGIGVKRSLKDLGSDRGAETYDFTIPLEENARERERRWQLKKDNQQLKKDNQLDREMDSYWAGGGDVGDGEAEEEHEKDMEEGDQMTSEAQEPERIEEDGEKRGTKRSAKERLGTKRVKMDRYNGQRLAVPGEAKHLLDIGDEDLLESSDKDFAHLLAERLGEEKPELLEGVVSQFGKALAHKIYKLTQTTEIRGGLEINNGARRRTSGGVFLYVFKTDTTLNIDQNKVRRFIAETKKQEDRKILEAKKRRKNKDFEKEMMEFLSLRKELKEKKVEEEEEGKMEDVHEDDVEKVEKEEEKVKEEQLVEIGKNAFSKFISSLGNKQPESNTAMDRLESFDEPEAPPNSVERVERPLQEYDQEDLFSHDTEDIELS